MFQSVTTRTAGFYTIPQENFTDASAFISLILMFIGGSPSGTAGGVKTVTVAMIILTAYAIVKNNVIPKCSEEYIRAECQKRNSGICD